MNEYYIKVVQRSPDVVQRKISGFENSDTWKPYNGNGPTRLVNIR